MRCGHSSFDRPWLVGCLVLAAGCRSIDITPAALGQHERPEHSKVLENWAAAVEVANEFLASPYRRTLPASRLELGPYGMHFVTAGDAWPIEVRATSWGDWVVRTGFTAQEREFGFVVGARPPKSDPLVDHSFFRDGEGEFNDPKSIAGTTLHEITHVIFREGTVGFWNAISYYFEAIFLFRYSKHADERHANATSEEFHFFMVQRAVEKEYKPIYREVFERHLEQSPTARCTHGPMKRPAHP